MWALVRGGQTLLAAQSRQAAMAGRYAGSTAALPSQSTGKGTTTMFTKRIISRAGRPGPSPRQGSGSVSPAGRRALAAVLAAPVVAAGVWLAAPTAFAHPTAATAPYVGGGQPGHSTLHGYRG